MQGASAHALAWLWICLVGSNFTQFFKRALAVALLGLFAAPAFAGCVSGRCAAPSAVIHAPSDNATYRASQDIVITGRAWGNVIYDNVGDEHIFHVSHVDIYADGNVVGRASLGNPGNDNNDIPYRDYTYTLVGGFAGGGNHSISVKAYDTGSNSGPSAGSVVSRNVVIASNASPSVSITSPANEVIVTVGNALTLTADASDADGSIGSVQFFDHDRPISPVLTSAPYTFNWTAEPLTSGGVNAVAIDNNGAATRSHGIVVHVNDKPSAQLHVNDVVTQAPGSITLTATASDRFGGIDRVEYLRNGVAYAAPNQAPFTVNWNGIPAGTHVIVARVIDTHGAFTDSAPYTWVVNTPPSVTIRSPANNTVQAAPSAFSLTAEASDPDGAVSSVQWLVNGTPISGELGAAPYAFDWSGVASGTYLLSARATDNAGGVSTSAPITVVSSAAPSVSLTSPANGSTHAGGSSIALAASATDSDGSIVKVEFLVNDAVVASSESAPYTATWPAQSGGAYVLQARATDSNGSSSTSAAISITVTGGAGAPPPIRSGNGTPGATGGSLEVTRLGTAQYNIPIVAPPGTGGMVPKLALNYDNDLGNGIAGIGWSVGGLGQISRCPRDFARDRELAGVEFSSKDRFCLDGQRLIVTRGTYGAPDSEYRTEIDNYASIVAVGQIGSGPASFLVKLPSGLKLEYGNSSDSRWTPAGKPSPLAWSMNKVSDPLGNYYTASYINIADSSEQLLARVDYTGNIHAPVVSPYSSVRFNYDQSRTDVETIYLAGARISARSRLANVETYTGETLVRRYSLAYTPSPATARSRVASVTECSAANGGACLAPTLFSWEETPVNVSGPVLSYPTRQAEFGGLLVAGEMGPDKWADLNGDGRPDHCVVNRRVNELSNEYIAEDLLCSISQPGGAAPVPMKVGTYSPESAYSFIDINADGFADVCDSDGCRLGSASGPTATFIQSPGRPSQFQFHFWSDVNGDGRTDYCRMTNDGLASNPYRMDCYLGNGSGFDGVTNLGTVPVDLCGPSTCESSRFHWADVTADGVQSFCRIQGGAMHCRKWTPSGWAAETHSNAMQFGEKAGRDFADVNGDGAADFCRVVSDRPGETGGSGRLLCTLSTGAGFGETIESATIDIGQSAVFSLGGRVWSDINGDGKADYCRMPGNGATSTDCLLSTGTGFAANVSFAAVGDLPLVDASGDGKPDLCGRVQVADGSFAPRCLTAAGSASDLLLKVSDGLGKATELSYRPLSDAAVYSRGTGADFPTTDVQDTRVVVQLTRTSNGIGGTTDTRYTYHGARQHQQGRGFLGYSNIESVSAAGVATRTYVLTNFPYTGLTQQTQVLSNNTLIADTVVTFAASGAAPYQVHAVKTVAKTHDLNGAFLNWVETTTPFEQFDAYGNALQVKTVYNDAAGSPDGFSKTVTTDYLNDIDQWIMGRPTRQQTVSVAPNLAPSTRTRSISYHAANPGLGLIRQSIEEPDNGNLPNVTNLRLVTDTAYDRFGNLLTSTISGANIETRIAVTNTYDEQGRGPMTIKNALDHLQSFEFDWGLGVPMALTTPNKLRTAWTYDAFGRKRTETRPDGTRETIDYNECVGCVPNAVYSISRTNTVVADGATVSPPTRAYFDALGREVLSVSASLAGAEVYAAHRYDSLGRVGYASMPYFGSDASIRWSKFDYDGIGRLTQSTAPNKAVARTEFNGRITTTYDADSVAATRTLNSQGKVVRAVDALGTSDVSATDFEYDQWGNLSKSTDAAGNVTSMEHDLRGRQFQLIDANLGKYSYTLDNLGQLRVRKDAKGQETTIAYDVLGRMVSRKTGDSDSHWYYEVNAAGKACDHAIGKLCEATGSNGYFRRYTYDNLGRPKSKLIHVDADYSGGWEYDGAGRLKTATFPATAASFATALALSYNYNAQGELESITNASTKASFWKADAENAEGNITQETYGNGLTGTRDYYPDTGLLQALKVGAAAAPGSVQNHSYHYDAVGRLDERHDNAADVGSHETFGYDKLNRLTSSTFTTASTATRQSSVTYDAIGNITTKTGVGTYVYPAPGTGLPHAVQSVTGTVNGVVNPSYQYDGNGNMETDGARSFTWTSFNMPKTVVKAAQAGSPGAGTSIFLYGPEQQRVKQTWEEGGASTSTIYLNEFQFEKEHNGQTGVTEYKHYVVVEGRVVAVQTRRSNGSEDVRYLLPDHQGSTSVVTSDTGEVVERLAFDPWGDRRVASGGNVGGDDPANLIQPASSNRGYTGHEHLDRGNVGLVHMNGRVYDPTLSRFISADPYVADPYATQSLNRYSYVWNSPLNATDPSGYVPIHTETVTGKLPRQMLGAEIMCVSEACGAMMDNFDNSRIASLERETRTGRPSKNAPTGCAAGSTASTCATTHGQIYQSGMQTWIARADGVTRPRIARVSPAEIEVGIMISLSANGIPFERPFVWGYRAVQSARAARAASRIVTPHGVARQSKAAAALAAREQVKNGATMYRMGTTGKSQAAEGQFWSLEHPLSAGYANKYGIPAANVASANFIEAATVAPGAAFITRPAPGIGANVGGGIEVVVPSGEAVMKWFTAMP